MKLPFLHLKHAEITIFSVNLPELWPEFKFLYLKAIYYMKKTLFYFENAMKTCKRLKVVMMFEIKILE